MSGLYVWDWDDLYTKDQLKDMVRVIDEKGTLSETKHKRKDGTLIDVELSGNGAVYGGQKLVFCVCRDITERKKVEKEREELIKDLREALAEIKTLKGILPMCASCNRIMDEKGDWQRFEAYIKKHSEAKISHGLCPDCARQTGGGYGAPGG